MHKLGKYVLTASLLLSQVSLLVAEAAEQTEIIEQKSSAVNQVTEEDKEADVLKEADSSIKVDENENFGEVDEKESKTTQIEEQNSVETEESNPVEKEESFQVKTVPEEEEEPSIPLVDIDSLNVNSTEAASGEEIVYTIQPKEGRKVAEGSLSLRLMDDEGSQKNILADFGYNAENKLYQAKVEVSDDWFNGKLMIDSIYIMDEEHNEATYFNKHFYPEVEEATSLDKYNTLITVDPIVDPVAQTPRVVYSTHVQSLGWQTSVKDGVTSGTWNQGLRLEAIKISLKDLPYEGSIEYQTHVQSYGWMETVKNGMLSGTEGKARRLEAIRINLAGKISEHYDVYYRVHAQSYGWLDWAKNGENAGTEGLGKRLEAIEIQLIEKGEAAPGKTDRPYVVSKPTISYTTHVQAEGWQNYVKDGSISGTMGQARRLEAIKIQVADPTLTGGVQYRTHVQSEGWQEWKANDILSGTEGKALRLEAIQIKLTGELAQKYDVYYRVHAQSFGWMSWAKNGESAGTEGLAKRLEGIEIVLVKKDEAAPGGTDRPYVKSKPVVNYATHVQKYGWQEVVSNGDLSGTSGKALRLEAILMNLYDPTLSGTIQYRTHVQSEGWQGWKQDWQLSGTQGKARRLEAIQIRLTEEMAQFYDVYYRVHAESFGWLGWAKNGESAGTEGLAKRLEAIEVKLVLKSNQAPGSTERTFVKK